MRTSDFMKLVAKNADISQQKGVAFCKALFDTLAEQIRAGEKVKIEGFGYFEARTRKSHTVRHPTTGEAVEVPARTVTHFREYGNLLNPVEKDDED